MELGQRAARNVGVYVDVANITMNGGRGMRYDVLRAFAARDGAIPQRLNAYVAFDEERGSQDPEYRRRTVAYYDQLRDYGYKVVQKKIVWFTDEDGTTYPKANVDMSLAVEALLQSAGLDRVILVTGDGDFTQVVTALQNTGARVEVVAFRNISRALREEADYFVSGYLIPNLLPTGGQVTRMSQVPWGEIDSRVRGVCYRFNHDSGFGFVRFIKSADLTNASLWVTDTRAPGSPYSSAFIHISKLPPEINAEDLPSRRIFLEFDLAPSRTSESDSPEAINVELAGRI